MTAWVVAAGAACVAAAVAVVALLLTGPVPRPSPGRPRWVLPSGAQLRAQRPRLVWRGYDPVEIDLVLAAAAAAIDALADEAGPETCAHAEQRLRRERGA